VKRFWFPLCREWLMLHGVINCSRESLQPRCGVKDNDVICSNVLGRSGKGQAAVKRFWFPLCREWLMLHGVINCSRESLQPRCGVKDNDVICSNVLGRSGKGQAAVLVVGGAEESLDAHPGKYVIMLSRRKGFIKIAIETGAFLVPCFAFGENDIYRQANNDEGTTVRRIQKFVKKYWGVSPLMVYGTGVFFAYGFMPFRKPLNTVLGAPIPVERIENPTQEQIDGYHSIYIQRLTELFEDHKEKYGIAADNHLIIR
ncbi:hypothetical protein PRIPAC_75238, partial [Pristionchus pacificus]|uniref:diacylglycerol O-acyltransferase n=1 Tax=Pristionchus pacificus TaxID=54126 RepID=A0A2A6CAF0_PRIPA